MSKYSFTLFGVFLYLFVIGLYVGLALSFYNKNDMVGAFGCLLFSLFLVTLLMGVSDRILIIRGDKNRNIRRNTERTS